MRRLAFLITLVAGPLHAQSYAPAEPHAPPDSTAERPDSVAELREDAFFDTRVPASLSIRGLPPVDGTIIVSADSGLVFWPADGSVARVYPVVGARRGEDGRLHRVGAVSVVGMDPDSLYLIRLHGAVLQTSAPGPLLALATEPAWLERLNPAFWPTRRRLVGTVESAALQVVVDAITASTYADTLYALFGEPARRAGLVGERGRRIGRLGEYLASRDSLALAPGRMATVSQLRHALAHELAHRWQRALPPRLRAAWDSVPPIDDPRRYGHADRAEQQAEAVAFAVHYLQTTAAGSLDRTRSAVLLSRYERFVPGTRMMVRELLTRPVYAEHPLRRK